MTRIDGRRLGRRRLLAGVGAAGAIGVAGCLGGEDPADDDDDDGTPRYAVDGHPIDEPMAFTDDHHCAVCNMRPANFPGWGSQLAHEDGTGRFFDTSGCLFAYHVAPERFDAPDSPVANRWTTDRETGELIDATEAHYVLERDETRHDDPMKLNPMPFEAREDAVAYAEEYDDLDEDDIVGFDDVDLEVARIYRERFLG